MIHEIGVEWGVLSLWVQLLFSWFCPWPLAWCLFYFIKPLLRYLDSSGRNRYLWSDMLVSCILDAAELMLGQNLFYDKSRNFTENLPCPWLWCIMHCVPKQISETLVSHGPVLESETLESRLFHTLKGFLNLWHSWFFLPTASPRVFQSQCILFIPQCLLHLRWFEERIVEELSWCGFSDILIEEKMEHLCSKSLLIWIKMLN